MGTQICLVLTENTIEKNLKSVQKYRKYIDLVELRVDYLEQNEIFQMRKFPALANLPVILTVRRSCDGGMFSNGEGARITIFARGLAFADINPNNNFAYVDFENDLQAPSLEEVAKAFNIKIIRSLHNINGPIKNIEQTLKDIRHYPEDMVKISFKASKLQDLSEIFTIHNQQLDPYIISATGKCGLPMRVLSEKVGSHIVYTFSKEYIETHQLHQELIDPITLNEIYRFKQINHNTQLFGVIGADVSKSKSPFLHNKGYSKNNINAVYIPISSQSIEDAMNFANQINLQGLSVTSPFKKEINKYITQIDSSVKGNKSINTLVKKSTHFIGYNTDAQGFKIALQEFIKTNKLDNMKIAIIGAGGVAYSVAQVIHELGGSACIFNRTISKASSLAKKYGFKWSHLTPSSISILEQFSDIIIQTTTAGSGKQIDIDPIEFYAFTGKEKVMDLIYEPEKTKILQRAEQAGCSIINGYRMLQAQAELQFKLYTGSNYE